MNRRLCLLVLVFFVSTLMERPVVPRGNQDDRQVKEEKTNDMELKQFLVKAKVACYAGSGEGSERTLDDGCKEMTYQADGFKYRDRYFGFNPFIGEEVVWQDEEYIWSMNYYGEVIGSDISAAEVYGFLQNAMGRVGTDRPFRGPRHFREGMFEYSDESIGSLESFQGMEKISWKGKEVYRLKYHGGFIRAKISPGIR